MTKIKICGLTRREDVEAVNEAKPDYIGFVFAESKRKLTGEQAKQLKKILHPSIQSVGVFVNEEPINIIHLCEEGIIDIIQLHGDESEAYINELKKSVNHPIIKAIRVKNVSDIRKANSYSCQYLLFDAFKDNQYGGCGEVFDWSLIGEFEKPYFLAGGINSENVEEAISKVQPYCIDVSSGVETNGRKDRNKIVDIVTKVRNML